MFEIAKKIARAAHNNTTYRVGLLQAKAYRVLKQHTTKALKKYTITTLHWAFLGILYEDKKGMRFSEIAKELGVEAPFVTTLFTELESKKYVAQVQDTEDSRAKIACLSPEGRKFVEKTEIYLKEEMRPLLKDVHIKELLDYLTVLEKIIKNNN